MSGFEQTHDLASSESLDETRLSNALEARYGADMIYTYVGDILVAVNPYRMLPLYTPAVQRKYMNMLQRSAQPPHLYAIADAAYNQMSRNATPQVAVISGESGAGKTESTKHFIRQIMEVSSRGVGAGAGDEDDGGERKRHPIEAKIMACNPVLEAFGNAQTVMNDNSSRFGKFVELKFNNLGQVFGASMSHYLLEKARVVSQGTGERNFHIFELLLEGTSNNLGRYHLDGYDNFRYLASRDEDKARLAQEWKEVQDAFPGIGFTTDDLECVNKIIAAILLLGQLEFKEGGNGEDAEIVDPKPLNHAAELLGVSAEKLRVGFMTNKLVLGSETIYKPLNVQKSSESRDAVSKAVYDRMFEWLVTKIDMMLCPAEARLEDTYTIGILDIFGFEDFKNNGFDQICINLANESLHKFFNTHIFASELEEYAAEGIDGASVLFTDNGEILNLFFDRPDGLFAVLDEETNFPSATDKTLMTKLEQQMERHTPFEMNKGGYAFAIQHYAGPITYQGTGLLDKNKDPLPNRMSESMTDASNPLAQLLFKPDFVKRTRGDAAGGDIDGAKSKKGKGKGKQGPKKGINTVSTGFRISLEKLMERMNRCKPHFVRCIKPNLAKAPGRFESAMVMKQLKYTGMLQTIEIRKDGYPNRPSFKQFIDTYRGAVFDFTKPMDYTSANCTRILQKAEEKQREVAAANKLTGKTAHLDKWIVAKTKVFLKYWHQDILDNFYRPMDAAAVRIQAWTRRYLAQLRFYPIVMEYRKRLAATDDFFRAVRVGGENTFTAQNNLIDEETRRGPEDLGIVQKMTAKEEAKAKKAMNKEAKAAVTTDAKANQKNAKKAQVELAKHQQAALKWWSKFEHRRNVHQNDKGQIYPWFHGLISRADAENFLRDEDPGTFLVRVSERANGYGLSFKYNKRSRHYKISLSPAGGYKVVGSSEDFPTLAELVEYFGSNPLSADGDKLGDPLLLDHDLNLGIGNSNAEGSDKKPKQNYEEFTPRGAPANNSPLLPEEYLRTPDKPPSYIRGKLSREQTEDELRKMGDDGHFVVRLKSQKDNQIVYALSYSAEGVFYHHLLMRAKGRPFTLNDRNLRVDYLEDAIEKFQDRVYPGLATRLQRSFGVGGISKFARPSVHAKAYGAAAAGKNRNPKNKKKKGGASKPKAQKFTLD